ncbi:MAG: thioesterase family protein [Chitinophagales bacterium]
MQRIKIEPPKKSLFKYSFTINEDDINMANHVGNERILVFANTIREKMFQHLQLNLLNTESGIIVANHSIVYKSEGFLGDAISCVIGVENMSECSFDLIFHFIKNQEKTLAMVRTGCVYFDYINRKIHPLPESYIQTFK